MEIPAKLFPVSTRKECFRLRQNRCSLLGSHCTADFPCREVGSFAQKPPSTEIEPAASTPALLFLPGTLPKQAGQGRNKTEPPKHHRPGADEPSTLQTLENTLPLTTGLFLRQARAPSGHFKQYAANHHPAGKSEAALGSAGALPVALWQQKAAPGHASCKRCPATSPLPAGYFLSARPPR